MAEGSAPEQPQASGAEQLQRLKVVVSHLRRSWASVLQRRVYLKALSTRADLHAALEETYAAQVTNAVQSVLIMDLLREIGALVLDRNPKSGSVETVVAALSNDEVMRALQAEYRVESAPPRFYGDDSEEVRAMAIKVVRAADRRRNEDEFTRLRAAVEKIATDTLAADIAGRIWTVRNKAVAHYDVVQEGEQWRMWLQGQTNITQEEVDQFVDQCSVAIDVLSQFVERTGTSFERTEEIAQKYSGEFVEALKIGLSSQRAEREKTREALRRRFEQGG